MSIGFYRARDYLRLAEFGVARRDGGPKTLILSYEQLEAMEVGLPMLRDAMCSGETSVGLSDAKPGILPGRDSHSPYGKSIGRLSVNLHISTRHRLSLTHV